MAEALLTAEENRTTHRAGVISVYDSSVHVWEEHVNRDMRAEVMDPLIRFLRRQGWSVRRDRGVHRILSPTHRYCRRGDLEAKLELSGRHLLFEMYQNVANVENPNGGRYDFQKMRRMPYLLRKTAELTQKRLLGFLGNTYGYQLAPQRDIFPRLGGPTALEWVLRAIRSCDWHYRPELDRCDWHGDHNRKSADGELLEHGQEVWLCDSKGRWLRGRAFYNLNNMWWVVLGPYAWANKGSFELYVHQPERPRRKKNAKLRGRRLREELRQSVDAEAFERAIVLRDILRAEEAA